MTLLAALLAAAAVLVWWTPPASVHRLARLRARAPTRPAPTLDRRWRTPAPGGSLPGAPTATGAAASTASTASMASTGSGRSRLLAAVVAGCAAGAFVGGPAGLVVGFLVAVVVHRVLGRLEPRALRLRRQRLVADLPLAADLLAGCLRAGRSPTEAIEVIAAELAGPLGSALHQVAAAFRLGADARTAWKGFLDEETLAAFGRAMVRVWDTGAPLAETLDRLAEDARAARRAETDRRARAVGVQAAAPLGLCFLPAFVLVGIVPLVAGALLN
ncbi:type II secretion system F family protein [Actinopolymorpha pittospori]|uniref:Flp pilus assembly protein TadB n=1 Tax=Actinopolymorpha pittospori TaxID=648752 RepID=A0A927RIP0_9ACTN|nr:Flp pilus assembly protein TadB [Actinopolymorpha pittospori]